MGNKKNKKTKKNKNYKKSNQNQQKDHTPKQIIDVQPTDGPLLKLIKGLVNYVDNNETTMLTNAELQTILHKELDVDIWSAHPLEVDVYMNIIKAFLKQWPNWDVVEKAAQEAKTDPKFDIANIINREYENFKNYLKSMLDLSKDQLKKNVAKLEEMEKEEQEESTTNVVLEVSCTRSQLNKLFFSQPNPHLDDTIFNMDPGTAKGSPKVYKLEELLHWPNLRVHVTVGPFEFVRTNEMHLQHTLINKKLGYSNTKQPIISKEVHSRIKNQALLGNSIKRTYAVEFLKSLMNEMPKGTIHKLMISNLLLSIVRDLTEGPQYIDQGNEYMYFPSRHAYVRYLKTDVNHSQSASKSVNYNNFLLHLEEIITPSVKFTLKQNTDKMTTKEAIKIITSSKNEWIKIECLECNTKFEGVYSMSNLKNHILFNHSDEPDVQCMECKKKFTMRLMAYNCWKHECTSKQ